MVERDPTQLDFRGAFNMDTLRRIFTSIFDKADFKLLMSLIVSFNDWLFNPNHESLKIILTLIVFDTMTGFFKAYKNHAVSSSGFFRFAFKTLIYLILLASAGLVDRLLMPGGYISSLKMVAAFLGVTEGISILENISSLGFAVPEGFLKFLRLIRDKNTEKQDNPSKKD